MNFNTHSAPPSPLVGRGQASLPHSFLEDDMESLSAAACVSFSPRSAASSSRSSIYSESSVYSRSSRSYSGYSYTDLQKNALMSWVTSVKTNTRSASQESLKMLISLSKCIPQIQDGFIAVPLLITAVKKVAETRVYNSSLHNIAKDALFEVGLAFQAIQNSESPCCIPPSTPTIVSFPLLPAFINSPQAQQVRNPEVRSAD
jgi:hypothetical protein